MGILCTKFIYYRHNRCETTVLHLFLLYFSSGVSNLSAMAGRIDFIFGVAGQYAIPAAVTAMFECELLIT